MPTGTLYQIARGDFSAVANTSITTNIGLCFDSALTHHCAITARDATSAIVLPVVPLAIN